jgi:tripartite-type tricarboxylate transporter receptor subunit TctC
MEITLHLHRRQFFRLATGAVALPGLSYGATAQSYPLRPVRWIVPFAPGGFADVIVRPVAQYLTEKLGQPFVLEHRPGAGTNIGTEAAIRAVADGYTLLFVGQASAVNASLYPRLGFNFIRDIAPIVGMIRTPLIMAVNPSVPARSVPEIIEYAKVHPGKLSYASGGNGTSSHLAAELFKIMAGVDMVHVPYRGAAPAVADLLGGQVHVMFDNISTSLEHVRSGRLHGLAVTTMDGSHLLPHLPAVAEFVPGFEVSAWSGVGAPKKLSPNIVERLNAEINASLAEINIRSRLNNIGAAFLGGSAADFGKLIADETEKWSRVVRMAKIEPA